MTIITMDEWPFKCESCGKALKGYALMAVFGEEAVRDLREGSMPPVEDSHFYCMEGISRSACYDSALEKLGGCVSEAVTVEIKFRKLGKYERGG